MGGKRTHGGQIYFRDSPVDEQNLEPCLEILSDITKNNFSLISVGES